MSEKNVLGLKKETTAAFAYLLGPISGFILLVLEKKDPFIRFHAMQSIVVIGVIFVLQSILMNMFFVGNFLLGLIVKLIGVGAFFVWLFLIYKAWMGEKWEFPYLGKIAKQLLEKA